MDRPRQVAARLLVVGADLAGAALAWLGARAGMRVTLVSLARPASRATALHPGLVHGPGPPSAPLGWPLLPGEALAASGRRAARGRELLYRFLLDNDDPVGIRPLPSDVIAGVDAGVDPERLAPLLAGAGFPVEPAAAADGEPVLRRARDAVLSPGRLVFSLLRRARELGAEIRIGVPVTGWRRVPTGGVIASIGDEERHFDHIAWTPDRPPASLADSAGCQVHLVLRQELGPGKEPLRRVLLDPRGMAILAPHPRKAGCTVLVRRGRVAAGEEIHWPPLPPSFLPHIGQALRQRLAEVGDRPPTHEPGGEGPVAVLGGLAGWPVASILGACAEFLARWGLAALP